MKIKFLLIINDKFVRMVLERRWSRARNVYGCFVDRNNILIEHFKRKYRFIEKKKLKLFGNKLIEDLIKIHTVMLSYRNIGIEKKSWMYFSNTVNKQLLYTCKRYRKIQNTIFFWWYWNITTGKMTPMCLNVSSECNFKHISNNDVVE